MNRFAFRPVGQGLFYTGSLLYGHFNFVYDCGTENRQNILNREIMHYRHDLNRFVDKPLLDFVVISHLHKDHYSGLYELVKNFRVKKIYLPYLSCTPDVLRLYLYYDLFVDNERSEESRESLIALYRLIGALYGINESPLFRENIGVEGDDNPVVQVKETTAFTYDEDFNKFWQFEFINKEIDSGKINEINKKCKKILDDANCANMQEFIEQKKDNLDSIAKAYKDIFGRGNALNNTSIVLTHYPVERKRIFMCYNPQNIYCWYDYCHCCGCCRCMREGLLDAITLLTGDMEFDKATGEKVQQCIKDKEATVLQIPHHGSKINWKALCNCDIKGRIHVIPFGKGNKYGHPDMGVIMDLIRNDNEFYRVTEKRGFVYCID